MRTMVTAAALVWFGFITGSRPVICPAQSVGGYGDYIAWENWARVQLGNQAGLASSYDREGGNYDFSQYEDPPGGVITDNRIVTAKTIDGPGIIYRFWMPHLTANQNFIVRMYFDGETTPRIDSNSVEILTGSFSYFADPLVTTFAGGQVCYEPIPFQTSLRIETENKELPTHPSWHRNRHYYQYTYLTFPPGTNVGTYTHPLPSELEAPRAAVVDMFNNAGQHPAGNSPTANTVSTSSSSIPPGQCLTLADLTGPGLIRQLRIAMPGANDDELNGFQLRVYYDDSTLPAIDVSVAHFFGVGNQRAAYQSIPLGTDSLDESLYYCYWPMPFRYSVLIALCNTTADPITVDSAVVEYEDETIDSDAGYLHAHAATSIRAGGQIYHPILSATGCGHYVGNLLYVQQSDYSFWMLEGDEVITVDGNRTFNGTGLEDAYSGGYYYNWVGNPGDEPEGPSPQWAIRPLHGILYVHRDEETPIARADQYRWQIADRVPFSESIDVKIENRYAIVGAKFTSVAFWYQFPPVPADFDGDCDVDQDDYTHFESCSTGPNVGPPDTGCQDADFDRDGDVDQSDCGLFQRCLSGPDRLGDPTCAD